MLLRTDNIPLFVNMLAADIETSYHPNILHSMMPGCLYKIVEFKPGFTEKVVAFFFYIRFY
jgi:hypothetical protein